jgi:hypothetical protein
MSGPEPRISRDMHHNHHALSTIRLHAGRAFAQGDQGPRSFHDLSSRAGSLVEGQEQEVESLCPMPSWSSDISLE